MSTRRPEPPSRPPSRPPPRPPSRRPSRPQSPGPSPASSAPGGTPAPGATPEAAPAGGALRFFCPCPRGLEQVLADELSTLGATGPHLIKGGVAWAGSLETCYRVNLWSRIASRVLCEIGRTPYRSAEDLYRSALEMPWGEWFDAPQTIRVDVTASRSPLESVDFALLRIKDAVCDQFRARCGQRPSVDTRNPEVRIWTFVDEQHATFYLDTSGEPLFKRGYRRARQEAPLKENLAAGLIALTHWDSTREAFLDPMCGSGTIAVEAALIATRTAPGLFRGFGFEKLRGFKPTLWAELRRAAQEVRQPAAGVPIVAADIRPALIEELRASLGPLGLAEVVSTRAGPVESASAPAECGVWLTNPPYGVRMGEAEALALMYRQIGQRLKAGFAGWRCYFFSADRKIPGLLGLREARRTVLYNGALECRLFEFPIVSGRLKG